MKKVALIYGSRIDAPTGASAVMRSFCNNIDLFENKGIELTVYSTDIFNTNAEIIVKKDNYLGFYKKCSKIIRKYATNHTLGAIISILVPYFRSNIVKLYISSNKSDDIVFVHDLLSCYKYIKQRKNLNVKIVLVMHSNGDTFSMYREYYKTIEKSFFYNYLLQIEKKVLKNIDRLGFVAEYPSKNFMVFHPEFDKKKIFYVYNGLALNSKKNYQPSNNINTYEICCVGTISERKGQRFIVEALYKISQDSNIPKVHFSIIGEGTIKEELEVLSKQYNVSKYISFYGSSSNVDNFLINSNIFILPSVNEGFPIAILEAMRVGLPIVSTQVGGIPEMIEEGYNGIFIEPSADGVYDFLFNIAKYDWKTMGVNSRDFFLKKFTEEQMIESYSNLLKSI